MATSPPCIYTAFVSVHFNTIVPLKENNGLIRNGTQFLLNSQDERCSWLVVHDDIASEWPTSIPRHRRILVITEPRTLKTYTINFINQFGIVRSPYPRPWRYKGEWVRTSPFLPTRYIERTIYQALNPHAIPREEKAKEKLLSVICSAKNYNIYHIQRNVFIQELKKRLGTQIDIYGHGHNPVSEKRKAIAPYFYHIVLENNQDNHFWSEKITDCYIGEAYPFYFGCKNLHNYFPKDSYTSIDIFKPSEAIQQIESVINNKTYSKNHHHILESKRLIIEKYNLLSDLDRIIRQNQQDTYSFLPTPETLQANRYYIRPPRMNKIKAGFFRRVRSYTRAQR